MAVIRHSLQTKVENDKDASLLNNSDFISVGVSRNCFCDQILEKYETQKLLTQNKLTKNTCTFCQSKLQETEIVWVCPKQCDGNTFICDHCMHAPIRNIV